MFSGETCFVLVQQLATLCSFYRPIVEEFGLWDQVRVDQGREWYLSLFVQEKLAHLRYNATRAPHLQTSSKLVQFTKLATYIGSYFHPNQHCFV